MFDAVYVSAILQQRLGSIQFKFGLAQLCSTTACDVWILLYCHVSGSGFVNAGILFGGAGTASYQYGQPDRETD
jgi:hypothetical protein